MIIGVGLDLVDVAEFARRVERTPALRRVFSGAEWGYAGRRPAHRAQILAARWAAKEAFGKALGTGLPFGWRLSELEVAHDVQGRPFIRLSDNLAARLPAGAVIHLTLSHTRTAAAAVVILEAPGSGKETLSTAG